MANENIRAPRRRGSTAPQTVAPTTKITVAFPFSHISLQEPASRLEELAVLMQDLADVLAESEPGPRIEGIRQRAHALAGTS